MTTQKPRYVLIKLNGEVSIIDDPMSAFLAKEYKPETDSLYQLGSKVTIQISFKTESTQRKGPCEAISC